MASEFGIGARLPRLEDARFLEGRGQFCADIVLPGMLHAAFVRSPHAHARIVAVRKPQGYEKRVFCAADLRGVGRMRSTAKLPGFKPSDWPILAAGKVRHVGEPIAMAIAATAAEAEDLAALVAVDFEPLPPVVTMADALKKSPPFVHDEWGDNVLVDIKLEAGDLNAAKSAAVHVIERSFRMNRMHPLPLEGRACVASYDSRLDELVVYVAHQLPVPLQIGLAQVLGISQRRLRVVVPDVGASFGLKTYVESETVCVAFAAMQLRRPVRWIQDRHELLICDATCRDYQCKITGYADASGRVLALDCDVTVDSGAYSPWPWPAGIEGGLAIGNMQGCYDIRAFRGRAINVVSNKPAGQPFRGVARPLSCIGHEIVMDGVAQAIGIDPLEVRLRNFVKPEQMPYVSITKKTLDSGNYAAALKRAAELMDMPAVRARQKKADKDGRLIGIGFASFLRADRLRNGAVRLFGVGHRTGAGHGAGGGAAHRRRRACSRSRLAFPRPGTRDGVCAGGARSFGHRPAQGVGAVRRHIDIDCRHRHLHVALDGHDRWRHCGGVPIAEDADCQNRRASSAMQGRRR